MVGHVFEFYATLKRENAVKDLKIRSDFKDEIEFGGTFIADEIKMVEGNVLRVEGEFGVFDLGIPISELKNAIKNNKEVVK